MKNDTLLIVLLLGAGAWAFARTAKGRELLAGLGLVSTPESRLRQVIFNLPAETDWRQRPEFNKPWLIGDIAQSAIAGAFSTFVPGGSTLAGLAVNAQNSRG